MLPGTSGHHPGRRRITVCAQPRQWDLRLSGAPCQRREAAGGRGMPPPRRIGRHQPLGRPVDQGPAAVEEIPPLATTGAADYLGDPLRVSHQPAEGEWEAGGEGDDSGAVVVEVHGADRAPTVWQVANGR